MSAVTPLTADKLYTYCDLSGLSFETTAELENKIEFVGQDRAIKAIEVGVGVERQGYNIFALGPSGTGKHTLIRRYVEEHAAKEPPPDDWCYVNNFDEPTAPRALRLPSGMGRQFRQDMEHLIEDLRNTLSSAFESEEVQTRRRTLEEEFQNRQQESLRILQEKARGRNLTLLRTPGGLAFAPMRDGEVIPPEEFQKIPEEEKKQIQEVVEELQQELQTVLLQVPRWEREYRTRLSELNTEVTNFVLDDLLDDLLQKYAEQSAIIDYLQKVREDVGKHQRFFVESGDENPSAENPMADMPIPGTLQRSPALRRYQVNVLVDSSELTGAPVIYESNPSYLNLVGRVEQMAMMGALVTDFTLIKPGVLHRANGGYLMLDARKLLTSPYAWEGLKRALQFGQIRIESPTQMMNLTSTITLDPEPIDLAIKVILLGDRELYYLLSQAEPEFHDLFKISADFDDEFVRDHATTALYAQAIASIVHRENLLPLEKPAVCRVVERSSRLVSDSERLTARMQLIVNLLEEADYFARLHDATTVTVDHVQEAIDAQIYRANRVQERMQEQIMRETVLIETEGERVGQINGLSVLQLGNYAFGRPSRITANVHMGKGEVVNIEREVELSGPLHSKGVLILSAFLRGRYSMEQPLSLGASLVFEQSYGGVDGDSASSTELYALLSAIADVPIRQALAVTGSVNQHGQVQAIGGVNEKIEGFFDLCNERGLTGEQGVLIPHANVKHMMLRHDITAAVADGQFFIYPIETIDQGIEVLTGIPAGEPDQEGTYPQNTINRMVHDRLQQLARQRREFDQNEPSSDHDDR